MSKSKTEENMKDPVSHLAGIEAALAQRLGTIGVSASLIPAGEPGGVPVMRFSIEGQDELPVFVTVSPDQVLCICYLWTEDEVKPERRAEMLEAMIDLNISIPLSTFGRIGRHYVIYGSLARGAGADDIATDIAMAADNAVEALDVFTEFLK
jgi:uncharacterized protein YjfI (DUF2170 family)